MGTVPLTAITDTLHDSWRRRPHCVHVDQRHMPVAGRQPKERRRRRTGARPVRHGARGLRPCDADDVYRGTLRSRGLGPGSRWVREGPSSPGSEYPGHLCHPCRAR